MKRLTRLFLILCMPIMANCAYAEGEAETQDAFSLDTSVGVFSDYMWRGLKLYDGSSIQPSVTANYDTGYGVVSANLWMHLSGDTEDTASRFTELDATLKYSHTFDPVTFSVGNAWYTYSDYGDGRNIEDSGEVFTTLAFDAPLSPVVSYYHDWDALDSDYFELGVSHEFASVLGEGTSLTPFAAFGWGANAEKLYGEDGLAHVTVGVSTSLQMGAIEVIPNLNYTFESVDSVNNQFWFGVTFAYSL